jgi:transcriptional regulator with XRE-family HTH domain
MSQDIDEEEVRRLLNLLRSLMRLLGFSNREIERRMGINQGSVSRVFSGHIEAKLGLVLGVARSIGMRYDEFFAFAYPQENPPQEESPAARSVRLLLEDIRPSGSRLARPVATADGEPAPAPRAEPVSREELIEDLRKVVREMMSELRPGGEGGSKAGNGHD